MIMLGINYSALFCTFSSPAMYADVMVKTIDLGCIAFNSHVMHAAAAAMPKMSPKQANACVAWKRPGKNRGLLMKLNLHMDRSS